MVENQRFAIIGNETGEFDIEATWRGAMKPKEPNCVIAGDVSSLCDVHDIAVGDSSALLEAGIRNREPHNTSIHYIIERSKGRVGKRV